MPSGLSGVKTIYSTQNAFAALKDDGTVRAWGDSSFGGSVPPAERREGHLFYFRALLP